MGASMSSRAATDGLVVMIVTCPNCNAKYRVRDEAVPASGAQLRCPECNTMFLARRPAHQEKELLEAVERLSHANQEAERKASELERLLTECKRHRDTVERDLLHHREETAHLLATNDAALRQSERRWEAAQEELQAAKANEVRLRDLETVKANLTNEIAQLRQELMTCRQNSSPRVEFEALQQALQDVRLAHQRLSDEHNADRGVIVHLQEELLRVRSEPTHGVVAKLEQELAAARAEVNAAREKTGLSAAEQELTAHMTALAPMLWALDQSLQYLSPFSITEPVLANHVRNLQLLSGMLRKLVDVATMSRGGGGQYSPPGFGG